MAALAQWMLTRIGKGKDMDASHGASGPGLDRAHGGGDNVLQVLVAIAGSGVFWMITGGLITQCCTSRMTDECPRARPRAAPRSPRTSCVMAIPALETCVAGADGRGRQEGEPKAVGNPIVTSPLT